MASTNTVSGKTSTTGDAAVGGLFHGLVAGLAMAATIAAFGLVQGIGPLAIWTRLAAVQESPLSSLLAHLAVSGVYGVIWALLWRPLHGKLPQTPAWAAGLLYGLILLLVAQVAAAALNPLLMDIGLPSRAAAHLVYGVVLGMLTARNVHAEP